ncbi:MAG: hypothetical protein ACT4QC_06240 [Planctomycetaceae bacterium]
MRSCRCIALRLLMLLALAGATAAADNAPNPSAESGAAPAGRSAESRTHGPGAPEPAPAWPFDWWYLWGQDGRPVAVPDQARLREFLDWLAQRRQREREPMAYSIAALTLTGAADDDRALLTANVRVQVLAADEWVYVPLLMTEGSLREPPQHQGPGDGAPTSFHAETGYGYWLRGKGMHELSLVLSATLRKQGVLRRLELSVPPSAVSSLRLVVPAPRVSARTRERTILTTHVEGPHTSLELLGLGNRLDLTWQPLLDNESQDRVLEANTSVAISVAEGGRMTIEASQRLQAIDQQRTFDKLTVSLPPHAELLRIEGPDYLEHAFANGDRGAVVVRLKRAVAGPVELRWTLSGPAVKDEFVLSGFGVAEARVQTGLVAVSVPADYRLTRVEEDDSLQRLDPADLPASLRRAHTSLAFRFLERLRLAMKFERIEPYVTTSAGIALVVQLPAVELDGLLQAQVLRGSVSELTVLWPAWRTTGWVVETLEVSGAARPELLDPDERETDRLRVRLSEPMRGQVELRIHARLTLPPGADSFPLSAPALEAAAQSPAHLAVFSADNLEVTPSLESPGSLQALEAAASRVVAGRETAGLRRSDFTWDDPATKMSMHLKRHEPVTVVSTSVAATMRNGFVEVRQRFTYQVSYQTLSQLRLRLPAERAIGSAVFSSRSDIEVRPRDDLQDRESRVVRLELKPPQASRFEVEARYALELPSDFQADATLAMPLIVSLDAPFAATRLQWRDPRGSAVEVEEGGWNRNLGPDGVVEWSLPRHTSTIVVQVSRPRHAPRGVVVTRALVRSDVGLNGAQRVQAEFLLSAATTELRVTLPKGNRLIGCWWNRVRVRAVPEPSAAGTGAVYVVAASPVSEAAPLLTIVANGAGDAPSRFAHSYSLQAPVLDDDIPVLETLWQVRLPPHQHLLSNPAGFNSENEWSRRGLLWGRQPRIDDKIERPWLGLASGPAPSNQSWDNVYLFSRSGVAPVLQFEGISRSGLVLVGAGAALLLGWLFVNWPITHHVLALLLVVFLLSLVAVWYPEPVLLLLQPAVLGLILGAVAVSVDGILQKKMRPFTIALNPIRYARRSFWRSSAGAGQSSPQDRGSVRLAPGIPLSLRRGQSPESGSRA